MDRKIPGIIAWLILLCVLVSGCSTDKEDPLKKVEEWYFTRYSGSITGGTQGQFDLYVSQFLTDSQWQNINPSSNAYSTQDDGDTNVTWYGVVSWMTMHNFSSEVINTLKKRLASNERAVYFYETYANGNTSCHWVRFVKN